MKLRSSMFFVSFIATQLLAFGSDWPQYRGPSHDGISTETMAKWPSSGLHNLWKVPTPGGFSSFAVARGRAFTLINRLEEYVGREACIALDADTGKELWATTLAIAKYDA